jgi:hypothetical protein
MSPLAPGMTKKRVTNDVEMSVINTKFTKIVLAYYGEYIRLHTSTPILLRNCSL